MNNVFILISIVVIGLFVTSILFSIYLIILLIYSKGFRISPTVSSSNKSTKKIIKFLSRFIKDNNKNSLRILDIGSGYGKLLFRINRALSSDLNDSKSKTKSSRKVLNKTKLQLVGYEISNFAYKISKFFNRYNNITLIKDDIHNLKDYNFDIVVTFILAKQQKVFLDIYKKFPKNTIIIANSLPIPFAKEDGFKIIEIMKVYYRWNIYVYKKVSDN